MALHVPLISFLEYCSRCCGWYPDLLHKNHAWLRKGEEFILCFLRVLLPAETGICACKESHSGHAQPVIILIWHRLWRDMEIVDHFMWNGTKEETDDRHGQRGENINKLKVPSFRSITTRLLISCFTGSGRQAKGHKYGTDQPSNREQVLRSRREMVTTSRCDYIDPSVRRVCPGFEPEKGRTHRYEDYLWVASRAANSNARVA